jgi:hypothetical protein
MSASIAHLYSLFYSDNFVRDIVQTTMPAMDQMWDNSLGLGTWKFGHPVSLRQGYLTQEDATGRAIIRTRYSRGYDDDGTITADMRTTSLTGGDADVAGLLFRYQSASSYYYAVLCRDKSLSVYKRSGTTDTLIADIATPVDPLHAYTMRVEMYGARFAVYLNNKLYLNAVDLNSPLLSGPAGFITNKAKAQFRTFMWYNDIYYDEGRNWTQFLVTGISNNESLPVNIVKIPYGIGGRVQAGVGMGQRTYHVDGTFLGGMGNVRRQIGNTGSASFKSALESLMRWNSPVALISPNVRTSGFVKNVSFPSSAYMSFSDFSFDLIEYYKNV